MNVLSNSDEKKRKPIKEYAPKKFEDVQKILQKMRDKQSVIITFNDLPDDLAQRLLDFLCGGVFALEGTVRIIDEGEYILIPKNVRVSSGRKE